MVQEWMVEEGESVFNLRASARLWRWKLNCVVTGDR